MRKFLIGLMLLPLMGQAQTLEECQRAAEQNYPLIRQYDLIEKTTDLTVENIIGLILMWTVSLVFGILFYRKTSRTYYAGWDITTICNQDAKYQKLLKWYNIATCMFWMAYTSLRSLFTVHDMAEFIVWLIIMALLAGASFVGLKLGKAINRRMPTDPDTGLPQSPKWLNAAIIIITLALAVFYVITKR